jgi:hypothetical protein
VIEVGTVNRQGFEAALDAARDEGSIRAYSGLSAPLDGSWLGKISEVWESVEQALRDAFVDGVEHSRDALDKAVSRAQSLIQGAGARARDVQEALLEKIQAYLSRLVDAALSQVRRIVEVGGIQLELDELELNQKVSLSGSVKAALTEIVALTADGELTVTASYKTAVTPRTGTADGR